MSTRAHARRRRSSGQAMVEMVVSLVVMVPLVLYTLFLADFLNHSLEWHETVMTPAWQGLAYDFVQEQVHWSAFDPPALGPYWVINEPTNYEDMTNHAVFGATLPVKVQGVNRLTYCDFSSTHESYVMANHDHVIDQWDPLAQATAAECSNTLRQSLGARITWVGNGASQIECELLPLVGRDPDPGFPDQGTQRSSGFLRCWSRASVTNRILGKKVYDWGGESEITDRTKDMSNVADAAFSWNLRGPPPNGSRFGMLHGSWSLNYVKNLDPRYAPAQSRWDEPGGGEPQTQHPFYKRVLHYYDAPLPPGAPAGAIAPHDAIDAAYQFGQKLVNPAAFIPGFPAAIAGVPVGLLAQEAIEDGAIGNDPRTPTIAYRRTARSNALNNAWPHPTIDPYPHALEHEKQIFQRHRGYSNGWGIFDVPSHAAGWLDSAQQGAWNNRVEKYCGRPEQTWVDYTP